MRRTQWIFVLLVAASAPAQALEVGGAQLAESVQLDPGSAPLVLNGAGVRQRLVFNVYSVGLYLRTKTGDAAQAISAAGPKRVSLHMLRDVSAEQFTEALVDGIRANHVEAEVRALESRMRELSALMAEVKEARKGMVIAIDWLPETGTVISIDGRARGKPIPGEDFYRALLRIWLGERPAAADLKKALLGQSA